MIVVATADFEIYHDVVNELRDRGVTFTTVDPDDELPERGTVVIADRDAEFGADAPPVVRAIPDDPRGAVDAALALLRGSGGRLVVGVDPGDRPGIAVLVDDVVVAAFHVPLVDAAEVIRREVADATDPVVRIGDGARHRGAQLINELEEVRVELVDVTGTTPHLGPGARGMGDVLAAVNIARLPGDAIAERHPEPTSGELDAIKARSRDRSPENREIDEALARRVARGELTIDEALAEHESR